MSKTIINMKDTKAYYELDKVSCFERPTAIVLGTIDSDYPSLFLMYRKFFQVYNVDTDNETDDNLDFIQKIEDCIFDKLGLECVHIEVKNDIRSAIIKPITCQIPVLVPGNLFELYYTDHYKSNDWPHLFLVNGYDTDNDLFYILDYMQNAGTSENQAYVAYEKFVIRGDDLVSLNNSFKHFSEDTSIKHFKKQETFSYINKREIISDFLQLLKNRSNKQQFIEKSLSEKIKTLLISNTDTTDKNLNDLFHALSKSPKYKEVMISEMLCLLRNYSITDDEINEMETLKEKIIRSWNVIIKEFFKNLREKNNEINTLNITEVSELENELYNLAYSYISDVKTTESDNDWHYNNIRLFSENNENQIISFNKDCFEFSFDNQLYNSWFKDNCPKAIWRDNTIQNNFSFSTRVIIPLDQVHDGFLASIFIRHKNGELFFWGVDNEQCYVFDFVGKCNLFRKFDYSADHKLVIKVIDQNLYYGIDYGNTIEFFGNKCFIEGIGEIGLACKTWEECRFIKVIFKDFELKEIKAEEETTYAYS